MIMILQLTQFQSIYLQNYFPGPEGWHSVGSNAENHRQIRHSSDEGGRVQTNDRQAGKRGKEDKMDRRDIECEFEVIIITFTKQKSILLSYSF